MRGIGSINSVNDNFTHETGEWSKRSVSRVASGAHWQTVDSSVQYSRNYSVLHKLFKKYTFMRRTAEVLACRIYTDFLQHVSSVLEGCNCQVSLEQYKNEQQRQLITGGKDNIRTQS